MEYQSKNETETRKIAAELAEKIATLRPSDDQATVIALEGELGAGKTTFVKAFANTLGIKEKITSPTYVILRKYGINLPTFHFLIHIDAYRLNQGKELESLGIDEIISDPQNIVIIEWAERVADILPKKYIKVHMDHIGENERRIIISD